MQIQIAALALLLTPGLASLLPAADLASYRDFRLGMTAAEVAKQAGIAASDIRLISGRPERIEELDWRTDWFLPSATTRAVPFKEVEFRFYNGKLFEMTIAYDGERTTGLTDSDMVEAISGVYGPVTKSGGPDVTLNGGFTRTVVVIASWEDAQDQVSLVRQPYGGGFGLVLSSTSVQELAAKAILESTRLDLAEAPERQAALKAKQLADAQAAEANARSQNKPGFRP